MRRNLAIFLAAVVLISALFFVLVFRPQSNRIAEATDTADAEEQRVQTLRAELDRLQELERNAPELRKQAARFQAAIPEEPRLAEFILQVQEAANASGIEWIAVNPTPPTAGPQAGTSDIPIQMNVNGGYFQVQDFLVRLETLPRAVKIDSVNLGAGPAGLPNLTAALSMTMFMSGSPPGEVPAT